MEFERSKDYHYCKKEPITSSNGTTRSWECGQAFMNGKLGLYLKCKTDGLEVETIVQIHACPFCGFITEERKKEMAREAPSSKLMMEMLKLQQEAIKVK